MDSHTGHAATEAKRFNWWKLAFFVALVAFEITREVAVLEGSSKARVTGQASVFGMGGHVTAEGRWKRIDGGEPIMPGAVAISCWRESGTCTEASVSISGKHISAPDISTYQAEFDLDGVSYVNQNPRCVTYNTRIDLKMRKAFTVRTRNEGATDLLGSSCSKVEQRIEMQLANGFDIADYRLEIDEHFVPIVEIIRALNKS